MKTALKIIAALFIVAGIIGLNIEHNNDFISSDKYIGPEKKNIPKEFDETSFLSNLSERYILKFSPGLILHQFTENTSTVYRIGDENFYASPMPIEISWVEQDGATKRPRKMYSGPFNFEQATDDGYRKWLTAQLELRSIGIDPEIKLLPWKWLQYVAPHRFNKLTGKYLYLINGAGESAGNSIVRAIVIDSDAKITEIRLFNDVAITKDSDGYHFSKSSLNCLNQNMDLDELIPKINDELNGPEIIVGFNAQSKFSPIFSNAYIEEQINKGRYVVSSIILILGIILLLFILLCNKTEHKSENNPDLSEL